MPCLVDQTQGLKRAEWLIYLAPLSLSLVLLLSLGPVGLLRTAPIALVLSQLLAHPLLTICLAGCHLISAVVAARVLVEKPRQLRCPWLLLPILYLCLVGIGLVVVMATATPPIQWAI